MQDGSTSGLRSQRSNSSTTSQMSTLSMSFSDDVMEFLGQSLACIICMESLDKWDTERLKCGHEFHIKCIKEWRAGSLGDVNQQCPVCRKGESCTVLIDSQNPSVVHESSAHQQSTNHLFAVQQSIHQSEQGSRTAVGPTTWCQSLFRFMLVLTQWISCSLLIVLGYFWYASRSAIVHTEGQHSRYGLLLGFICVLSLLAIGAAVMEKCYFGVVCGCTFFWYYREITVMEGGTPK